MSSKRSNDSEKKVLESGSKGVKFDVGKIMYELIPTEVLKGLAQVLTFGANKYAPRNWEKGIEEERLLGAAFRHIELHREGELLDPETGFYHLDHAAWNLLAASTFRKRGNNT